MLDGLRFVARDPFMGGLVAMIVVFGFFCSALSAALPAHAYLDFGSPRIAGLFYSALGAGALVGTILAVGLLQRRQPLRLAATAILGVTMPLWLLGMDLPTWVFTLALFSATLFTPLVNGPDPGDADVAHACRDSAEGDDGDHRAEHRRGAARLPARRTGDRPRRDVGRLLHGRRRLHRSLARVRRGRVAAAANTGACDPDVDG